MSAPWEKHGMDWRDGHEYWQMTREGHRICPRCGSLVHSALTELHAEQCNPQPQEADR